MRCPNLLNVKNVPDNDRCSDILFIKSLQLYEINILILQIKKLRLMKLKLIVAAQIINGRVKVCIKVFTAPNLSCFMVQ